MQLPVKSGDCSLQNKSPVGSRRIVLDSGRAFLFFLRRLPCSTKRSIKEHLAIFSMPFFPWVTSSAMDGASGLSVRMRGFLQKTCSKKWQGGRFLRAFRGLPSRPVLRTHFVPPPIPAVPVLQTLKRCPVNCFHVAGGKIFPALACST